MDFCKDNKVTFRGCLFSPYFFIMSNNVEKKHTNFIVCEYHIFYYPHCRAIDMMGALVMVCREKKVVGNKPLPFFFFDYILNNY